MGKECYSADIEYVDFNDIAIKARDMAEIANEAKNEILNAYDKIKDMSQNWYGTAYDKFVGVANKYIEPLDDCFELCTNDIPVNLIYKANEYCRRNLDPGSLTWEFPRVGYRPFEKIPVSNRGTAMGFNSATVTNNMNDILNCFNAAERKLDETNDVAQSIKWESGSGTVNKQYLESQFNKIKEILSDIAGNLQTIVGNIKEVFDNTEDSMAILDVDISEDDIDASNSAANELIAEIKAASSSTWETASTEFTGGMETNISGDEI